MWTLTSKKTGKVYYLLPEKEKHTVGRSSSDLALTGDTSISRSHACIYISQDSVKVVDVGSRYGTFCNENIENKVAMEKNVPIELKNGERIQFGMLENEWVLSKLHISTLTSTLNGENKAELQKTMKALSASIIDKWEKSCTHLTMTEITVTHKVLQALVENVPIVTLDFWRKYLTNLRANQSPPVAIDYLPTCAESFINHEDISFGLVPGRKTIFAGKTFVFMSNTPLEKYRSIIENAGGKCESLYKGVAKSTLIKKNVIVIRSGAMSQTQCSQTVDSIQDFIKSKGRRLIPDAEIGLSILHCSITKYCNPDYKIVADFIAETNHIIPNSNIIAKHTSNLLKSELDTSFETAMEIPDSAILEKTEKFKAPVHVDLNDSDIEIIDCSELAPKRNISLGDTSKNDITAQGKRKRDSSIEHFEQARKKMDTKRTETATTSNSNPVNNVSMSSAQSHNLEKELPSQPSKVSEISRRQSSQSTSTRKMIDVSRFIDTSQIRSQAVEPESEIVPGGQDRNPENKKRARVAAICSDDDDDLFAFDSTAPKKMKPTKDADRNIPSKSVRVSQRQARSQNNQNTEKQVNKATNQSKTKFQLPAREPIQIPTTGWLSKSMCEMKIKSETDKENVTIKEDPDSSAWISSLKGGFEVRVRPMNLVSRSFSRSTSNGSSSACNDSSTRSVKNFKAFVKRHNYKPQTSIISTVPVYVGVKSHFDF